VFAAGSLVIWLAGLRWTQQSDDNPFLVLLLVWVIAGMSHVVVKRFWRACVISAIGSVIGYAVLAVVLLPNPFNNEMFGAGMIEVGLFGFLLAMVMGIPVVVYRRARGGGRGHA
jgi:membrane protein DedA with SNARE-associated domain